MQVNINEKEEDILIATEFAKLTFFYGGRVAFTTEQMKKYQTAIENLINRVKELEENQIWSEATITGLKQDFIPKSKIREKIEKYEHIVDKYEKQMEKDEETDLSYEEAREYACKIALLQELLEDK